jgi:hypothetical protein
MDGERGGKREKSLIQFYDMVFGLPSWGTAGEILRIQ